MGVKRSSGAARVEEQVVLEWKRYAARRARSADKVAAGACYLEPRPCPFEARPDFETRFVQDCVHCARLHDAAERTGVASPGSSGVLPSLPLLIRLVENEGNGLAPSPGTDGEDGRWRAAAVFLRTLPLLHASSLPDRTARILLAAIARAYEDVVDTILFFEVPAESSALTLLAAFRHADLDVGLPAMGGPIDVDALESTGAFDGAVFDRLREGPIALDQDRDLLSDAAFEGRTAVVQRPSRELRLPSLLVEHLPDAPVAILPVFGRERVRGLLVVSAAPGIAGWTSDQMELLTAITAQTGLALEASGLLDMARRRGTGLRSLLGLAVASLKAQRPDILEAALSTLSASLEAPAGMAWTWQPRTAGGAENAPARPDAPPTTHGDPAAEEADLLEMGVSLRHWLEADTRPIVIDDVRIDPRLPGTLPPGWLSAMAVPLKSEDMVRGAILLVRTGAEGASPRPFSPDDVAIAELGASIVALVATRDHSENAASRSGRRVQELEAQLRHADRMSVVGERGIQVAQEIRNPIAAITGFARRVLRSMGESDPNKEAIEIILRETERLERILVEQVSLAQMTRPRLKLQSLNALVQEVLELQSEELVRRRVRLLKRLSPEVPSLLLDGEKMRHVLLHILQYALQQVPSGGRVRVETRTGTGHVQAEIAHDGPKSPGESLDRLFVPFSMSRRYGAGVGLAVAYQIVREHGGEIRARSEGDWSSILTIYLPVLENQDRRGKPDRRAGRNDRRRRLA
jgi:signal transduction histidine kinase